MNQTIFEKSQKGQSAYSLPDGGDACAIYSLPSKWIRKTALELPEISEVDLTRHFCGLARRSIGVDNCFYPLGSCTMKFNPRIDELCAKLPNFTQSHPLAPDESVQGNLEILFELIQLLCHAGGMDGGSLTPNAGAQGEFAGVRMISAYHKSRGDQERRKLLIPDNAHGTNPATASMAGFEVVPIRTNANGDLDLEEIKKHLSPQCAGMMLTNPNTLGLFSGVICEIASLIHEAGGLLYYDGANLNSILNIVQPGQMGFDLMHINLHKTFSTPHGGGGPGSGPILCRKPLLPFLPLPRVFKTDSGGFATCWNAPQSIGQIASFHGNFGICVRAFLYAKLHGNDGLRKISEMAVLNANYLKKRLSSLIHIPFPQLCMHEFVVQADCFLEKGVKALDIAKRLLDYGVYAPTIYFPLIIKECMLIEPTESESKATLDDFVNIFEKIMEEAKNNPELVKTAPHHLPVSRLDEVQAAKRPILKAVCSNVYGIDT